ncbi:MAG: FAD-dependent monooxygenase [Gammaproteobacteria bacterium]|nr:FAD-dependent monooxygenase [Gammaproteobacteria bacterium]MXW46678.1 2-octaprenyl-6-methoxyphenyl hydroxylase [Gammaproteobacteria bacterium]MYD00982.1 2-octaprenyl-6-methoxyphenyl hydroxylase [Gammaproteobacteria bacterium]MYI24508.1 2-octaprenyl-6-methoxyphenyl hydroxylase [Gammaproteobacteria bacterium]
MYAVLVAGGGLTGASLAVALADLGLKVAVVEAVPPEDPGQPSLDDRTSAIARTGVRILENLGVWTRLAETPSPIRAVEISERGCFGGARIDAASQGLDSLGSVVRNRVLGQALWERLRESDCIDIFCPARVRSVEMEADRVRVSVKADSGKAKTLDARLLAVAEGARSPLREKFGIAAEHKEYPQVALTGLAEVRRVIRPDTAWERFTVDGPLAVLPAGGRRYGFVIVTNRGAERLGDMSDADLLGHLQELMGYRAGEFVAIGPRAAYPLALDRAERVTAPRSVLVGAAANSVHPLVAQGFNLALRDVAALSETLAVAGRPPADPGDPALLTRYASWRRQDQANVVRFTDGLARLSRSAWLRPLRGLGLQAFDILPQAKPQLARFALGQGGRMSRLARGLPL